MINELHLISPEAQHPDLVVSKTLGLTDQKPRVQNVCPPPPPLFGVTPRLIIIHLHIRYPPSAGERLLQLFRTLGRSKTPPDNLCKEFPKKLEAALVIDHSRVYFLFNQLLCACCFPSGGLYSGPGSPHFTQSRPLSHP